MALCVSSFSYPIVSQVGIRHGKNNLCLVMCNWFIAANAVVMNSYTNATNFNAKAMSSIAKVTSSTAMDKVNCKGDNSIAKTCNNTIQ